MTEPHDRLDERMDAVLSALRQPPIVARESAARVAAAAVLAQSPASTRPALLARMAATLAVVALGGALVARGREATPPVAPATSRQPAAVGSATSATRYAAHTVAAVRPIVFELEAPAARSVQVLGDFNDWARGASMQRGADGRWRLTTLLPPGRYIYAFLVDGRRFTRDPLRDAVEDRDFGVTGSEVVVGEAP